MSNGRTYALGSAPDVVARLRQAVEANQTTRVVLEEGLRALHAIKLHLDHKDDHLNQLIADIEGRQKTER